MLVQNYPKVYSSNFSPVTSFLIGYLSLCHYFTLLPISILSLIPFVMLNKFQIISYLLSLRAPASSHSNALGCLKYITGKWHLALGSQDSGTTHSAHRKQRTLISSSCPCSLKPRKAKLLRNIQEEFKLPAFILRTGRNDDLGMSTNLAYSSGHCWGHFSLERTMVPKRHSLSRGTGSATCASPRSKLSCPLPRPRPYLISM